MLNSQNNIPTVSSDKSNFNYEINLFDIDIMDLSCYNLGNNELIFQSSKPPYNIQCLIFTKTLQGKHHFLLYLTTIDFQLLSFTNKSIKRIVANELSFNFLTNGGILYTWELTGNSNQIIPKQMSYFNHIKIIAISQSRTSTICYDSSMNIYCWGYISHLTGKSSHYPIQPVLLPKATFSFETALSKVVCGENYALFLNCIFTFIY